MKEIVELIKAGENNLLQEKLNDNPSFATATTEQGITLLQFAAYCRNKKAVDIIRAFKEELDLFEAATVGDLDALLRIIEGQPGRLNEYSVDGFTPLGLASFFGHQKMVEALLQKGADPNLASVNAFKVTPLHSACAVSNFEIAELLIKSGADVKACQTNGVTPLHSAAHNGMLNLVKLLVANGADIHSKMDNGQTPLQLAEENGTKAVIGFLLEHEKNDI